MKEGISFVLDNLVATEEKIAVMGEVQLYRRKVSSLFTSTSMIILKTSHPQARDVEPVDLDKLNELPEYVDHEQDTQDETSSGGIENINDDVMNGIDLVLLE
uniref:Uncharacterized protein n=1 Tax=Quercus lobata TaxID=97700 RepID=A0A7N2MQG8_QUELO